MIFSSLDELGLGELPFDVFGVGKRSRFNRIGFELFVGVVSLGDGNKTRLAIDGVEQGNEISTTKIKILQFLSHLPICLLIEEFFT